MDAPAMPRQDGPISGVTAAPVEFGGCDYLGLARHPRLIEAATRAAARFGMSTSASRTTTGNCEAHDGLEAALDAFFAPAFPEHRATATLDGLTANIAAFEAVGGPGTRAIVDERAHRSIVVAARAAGCEVVSYAHGDASSAAEAIGRTPPATRPIVATDGVFAADGAVAPVAALLGALPDRGWMLVDDCHGVGVLGEGGRGSAARARLSDPRVVVTSTLAKAIGAGGGFVLASGDVSRRIRTASTAFVGTTPISPAVAAASEEALRVIDDEPWRVARLASVSHRVRTALRSFPGTEWDRDGIATPVVAIDGVDERTSGALSSNWRAAGVSVPCIEYPCGPSPRYFRVSVCAVHRDEEIATLIGATLAAR